MIKYYNRKTKNYEIEKIAGENYLKWTYESPIGLSFLNLFVKKKLFSKLYGSFCDTRLSAKKIQKFIEDFGIDMLLSKKNTENFTSFNDFFSRELISSARPIDKAHNILVSPADGRISVYEDIDLDKIVQIKGFTYSLRELLGDYAAASNYKKGICLIVRLCPTDYHRFHFIDNGTCSTTTKISGDYYSVNPIALSKITNLFCRNKREWSVFHSENFGDILYVEVGATCVGTIIQTYTADKPVKKGDEKGYFKFGGSTVILFFEKDKIRINKDILEQSKLGFETKVNMGEIIGEKI